MFVRQRLKLSEQMIKEIRKNTRMWLVLGHCVPRNIADTMIFGFPSLFTLNMSAVILSK